jgi:hypothetical protein
MGRKNKHNKTPKPPEKVTTKPTPSHWVEFGEGQTAVPIQEVVAAEEDKNDDLEITDFAEEQGEGFIDAYNPDQDGRDLESSRRLTTTPVEETDIIAYQGCQDPDYNNAIQQRIIHQQQIVVHQGLQDPTYNEAIQQRLAYEAIMYTLRHQIEDAAAVHYGPPLPPGYNAAYQQPAIIEQEGDDLVIVQHHSAGGTNDTEPSDGVLVDLPGTLSQPTATGWFGGWFGGASNS